VEVEDLVVLVVGVEYKIVFQHLLAEQETLLLQLHHKEILAVEDIIWALILLVVVEELVEQVETLEEIVEQDALEVLVLLFLLLPHL
jgi:hypothetical protein